MHDFLLITKTHIFDEDYYYLVSRFKFFKIIMNKVTFLFYFYLEEIFQNNKTMIIILRNYKEIHKSSDFAYIFKKIRNFMLY